MITSSLVSAAYRSIEAPITVEPDSLVEWRPRKEPTSTLDLAGDDGQDGSDGSSGWSGRDGTTHSDGSRGPGGDGTDGSPGGHGTHGRSARSDRLTLRVAGRHVVLEGKHVAREVLDSAVFIDARGGDGGRGGHGGSGGSGGSGSPSGSRGRDGAGGHGGSGGDGGDIVVETDDAHLLGLIAGIDVRGGQAGSGGRGSPPGRNGSAGEDGSALLVCGQQEGRSFGAVPRSIVLAEDGRIDRFFSRGSPVVIRELIIDNPSHFTIEAPYDIELVVEQPLQLETAMARSAATLTAGSKKKLEVTVSARVPDDCDLGYYGLRIDLRSTRAGLRTHLTASRDVELFRVGVNHRLYESEIETDGSPQTLARLHAVCAEANAMAPEQQMALFCGAIFATIAREVVLTCVKRDAIGETFRGRLLNPLELWAEFDRLREDPHYLVTFACALHFFAALPLASREKIMDASFHAASRDGVLDAGEKTLLLKMADRIGLDREWVGSTLPRIVEPGDSEIVARRTNVIAALAAAALIVPATMVVRAVLTGLLGPKADAIAAYQPASLDFLTMFVGATLAFEPLRRALVRTSCSACASIEVERVADTSGASMTGDVDMLRCFDCGARGSMDGGDQSFHHADCGVTRGAPWKRIGIAAFVLIALAFMVRRGTAPSLQLQASPTNVIAFVVAAGICAMVLIRARRVSPWAVLFAVVATAGLLATVCS